MIMGFRIIELLIIAGLLWFIANVFHYMFKVEGNGFFFLSKHWEEKEKAEIIVKKKKVTNGDQT